MYALNNTLSQLMCKNNGGLNSSVSKNVRETSRNLNLADSIEKFELTSERIFEKKNETSMRKNPEANPMKSLTVPYNKFQQKYVHVKREEPNQSNNVIPLG